jgi:WD40 repeat protein
LAMSVGDSPYCETPLKGTGETQSTKTASVLGCTVFDTVSNWLVSGSTEGTLQVVDLNSFATVGHLKHHQKLTSNEEYFEGISAVHALPVPCGPDNEVVVFSGCSKGVVKCWMLPNLQKSSSEIVRALTMNKNSSLEDNRGFRSPVSSPWTSKPRFKTSVPNMLSHKAAITCLASYMYHNGNNLSWLLASADRMGGVQVTRQGSTANKPTNNNTVSTAISSSGKFNRNGAISALAFVNAPEAGIPSIVDPILAVGSAAGGLAIVDLVAGRNSCDIDAHHSQVSKLLSLKQNEFISAGLDRSIKLWDVRMKQRAGTLAAGVVQRQIICIDTELGKHDLSRCAASPITEVVTGGWDNSLVMSASADGYIRVWDLRYDLQNPVNNFLAHSGRISSMVWNGRKEFFSASYDGTVKSWDSINGRNTSILNVFYSTKRGSLSSRSNSTHGHSTNFPLHEGISSMKMTDFTVLEEEDTTKTLKSRSVIITSGVLGTLKTFSMDRCV